MVHVTVAHGMHKLANYIAIHSMHVPYLPRIPGILTTIQVAIQPATNVRVVLLPVEQVLAEQRRPCRTHQ